MILVDVTFPELEQTVDFQLDESVPCWDIAEDIADMAARHFGREYAHSGQVLLYAVETASQLNLNLSLKENGVQSGNRLLLI
jgi:hypothetical protein